MNNFYKMLSQGCFTYKVISYDCKTKLYTLEHPVTKEKKFITKDDFNELYKDRLKIDKQLKNRN